MLCTLCSLDTSHTAHARIRNSSIRIHWGQYCVCKTFTVASTFIVCFHFASSLHSHLNVCLTCMTMWMVFMTNLVLHFKKEEKETKGNKNIHHFYWQTENEMTAKRAELVWKCEMELSFLRTFIYISVCIAHSRCCYFTQNICYHHHHTLREQINLN